MIAYLLANIDTHLEIGKSAWANFCEWIVQAALIIAIILGAFQAVKRIPGVQSVLNMIQRLVVKPVKVAVKETFTEDVIGPIVKTQLDAKLDPFIAKMETQFGGNGGGIRQKIDEISNHLTAVDDKLDTLTIDQGAMSKRQDTMQASIDQQHVTTTIITTPGPVEEAK